MKENRLQRQIREELENMHGCYVLPIQPGMYIRKGEPDLIGCYQGRAFVLETKTPTGGLPTDIQIERLNGWATAGAIIGVPRSVRDAVHIVIGLLPSGHGMPDENLSPG